MYRCYFTSVCGRNTQCSIRVSTPLAQVWSVSGQQESLSTVQCPADCTLRHCSSKPTWQLLQVSQCHHPLGGWQLEQGVSSWHNPPSHPDGKLEVEVHVKVPLQPYHTLPGQPASPGIVRDRRDPNLGGCCPFTDHKHPTPSHTDPVSWVVWMFDHWTYNITQCCLEHLTWNITTPEVSLSLFLFMTQTALSRVKTGEGYLKVSIH